MMYITPTETYLGLEMMIKALSGDSVTFTKFKIGNGQPDKDTDIKTLNDLINPIMDIDIANVERTETTSTMTGKFDLSVITEDFKFREIGLFAKDNEGNECLYAYSNEGDDAGTLKANPDNVLGSHTFGFVIAISQTANIKVILNPELAYLKKDEFNEHMEATNPHKINAETIGLGNVENKRVEDCVVTFVPPGTDRELARGETLKASMGKIAKIIKSFLEHTKAKNPHKLDSETIGAAAVKHEHSAADITKGILGIARGGTGCSTLSGLAEKVKPYLSPRVGYYVGDGTVGRAIAFGYSSTCAAFVMESTALSGLNSEKPGIRGGIAYVIKYSGGEQKNINVAIGSNTSTWDDNETAVSLEGSVMRVNYNEEARIYTNEKNKLYFYIIFK